MDEDALVIERQQIGYVVVTADLIISQANQILHDWRQGEYLAGRPVVDVFPELFGMEQELRRLLAGEDELLSIPQIHYHDGEDSRYFDLQVEALGNQLLVTMADVTQRTHQAQQLQQQRNELRLLTEQLNVLNAQLDYLLKRFVPEQVAQQLIDEGRLPAPGGEFRREATVLFADMRNFSAFAETAEPEEAVHVLNSYFTVITEAIGVYNGSIVQIVGDMLMAAFNVAEAQPNHVDLAVQAAWLVRQKLVEYAQSERPPEIPALGFGLGLSSGLVTVGYLGAKNRYRYAVVGDTTNVAFHLCSRAAVNQIIVNDTILEALTLPVSTSELGMVSLKRRRQPLAIYELTAVG